ncbi:DsbA family oxidoreductase [Corynebacterium pseudopelargi]|uniref:DSBA-like thioredoxin domain protein n=1 Tax=Corynebacterium pseudopelargi TaxID=2080757 RepID=A0A3G6IT76_9CORY|nr:DsbA family oxidoreductase [Corynebacterium pseudopelargi]AZA08869.1 DSBA-like thioredoxin domain protein [Corynebacterium pseudopelargi]
MRIDIWTDVVCPFCFIGKEHLNQALETFEHADDVEVHWRAFELDPSLPAQPDSTLAEAIAKKYGASMEESAARQRQMAQLLQTYGVEFNWEDAKFGNTLDAHRLIQFAQTKGKGAELQDALMRAYLENSQNIAEHPTLLAAAKKVGLDASEVQAVLDSDDFREAVHQDEAQGAQIGIRGVPFFVFDGKFAVSGAQPKEVFDQALDQAWADSKNLLNNPEQGSSCCGGGGCCS